MNRLRSRASVWRALLGRWVLLGVGASCFLAGAATAQSDDPLEGRTVASWDFEERELHLDPVPLRWFRVNGGAGVDGGRFPAWNRAEMSDAHAVSGNWSVMLPTAGGSTAMRLASGVIPVLPGARYAVTAMVRTEGLDHAAARVRAWTLDAQLRPLDSGQTLSEPVRTEGVWKRVTSVLEVPDDAAWFQVEVLLLQPEELRETARAPGQVIERDFSGAAWFDDIALIQVPHIEMTTTEVSGMYSAPRRPALTVRIEDMTRRPLDSTIVIHDIDGNEIARREMPRTQMGRPIVWEPDLPAYGWYRAVLRVSGESTVLGAARCDFVWGPDIHRTGRVRGLGVVLDAALTDDDWVEALLRFAEPRTVELPIRAEYAAAGAARAASMLEHEHELVLVVQPPALGDARAVRDWMGSVADLVARLGERARRVQVGSGDEALAFWAESAPVDLQLLRSALGETVPRPVVVLPWDIRYSTNAVTSGADALSFRVPWTVSAPGIAVGADAWSGREDDALVLEPMPASMGGRRVSCESMVKKAVTAWASGIDRVMLDGAVWIRDGRLSVSAELAAWRTIAQALGGAAPAGSLPAEPRVRTFIGQRAEGGVLIAWSDGVEPESAVIEGYMGSGPFVLRDIFGNRLPLNARGGMVRIELGQSPVILEGVDPRVLRFRAGMRFEPRVIPARIERQEGDIVISNPWDTPIAGRVRLAEPGPERWEFGPRVIPFRLAPGETRRVPVEFSFGPGEESGRREIIAEVEVRGESDLPQMRIPMPVDVALEGIELSTAYRLIERRDGGPSNVLISLVVTNTGTQPIALEAMAFSPGFAGQQAPVGNVRPGDSVTRTFVFESAADAMAGTDVRIGLVEIDGTGRLNRTLRIQP